MFNAMEHMHAYHRESRILSRKTAAIILNAQLPSHSHQKFTSSNITMRDRILALRVLSKYAYAAHLNSEIVKPLLSIDIGTFGSFGDEGGSILESVMKSEIRNTVKVIFSNGHSYQVQYKRAGILGSAVKSSVQQEVICAAYEC